ncbi:HipA family kinase [Burkholderia sp. BCC0322]|uniref:HipA family kinase n=1 Tax=unclassified Burkholderia TaxID=2613784 RepID=UPI0015891008|nr:HipA family kinase [Burkholderia sp. BCC0322]
MSGQNCPFEEGRLNRAPIFPVSGVANPVVQARIHVPVRIGTVDAYVKLLRPKAFAAESVCAWLAIRVGLPIPTPFWVTVHRRLLQNLWPFGSTEAHLCFGSEAVPSAMALRLDAQSGDVLARHGLHLTMLGQIALFDELVGNDDRHDGNLLLTYDGSVFLIDHERAIGGTGLGLFSTDPPLGPNRLLERVRKLPASDRMALAKPLREFCANCERAVWAAPFEALVEDASMRALVQDYLMRRAERLRDTLEAVLGIPDLSGLRESSRPSSVL